MSGALSLSNDVLSRALERAVDRVTIDALADRACSILKSRAPNQSINELASNEKAFFIHLGKLCQSMLVVGDNMQLTLDEDGSTPWLMFKAVRDAELRSVCSISADEPLFSVSDSISSLLSFRWNNRYNEIAKSIVEICVSRGFEQDVAESLLIYSGSAMKIRSAWRSQLNVKAMMDAVGKFYQTLDRDVVGLTGRFCKRISIESYVHVKQRLARYRQAAKEGGALAALALVADRFGLKYTVMENWSAGLSDAMLSALKEKSSRYLYWPTVLSVNTSVMSVSEDMEHDDRCDEISQTLSFVKTTHDQCGVLPAESLLIKAVIERGVAADVRQTWLSQVTQLHQAAPRRYPIERLRRSMDILKEIGLFDATPHVVRRQIESVCDQQGEAGLQDSDHEEEMDAPLSLLTRIDPDHPSYCLIGVEPRDRCAQINEVLKRRPFQVFRYINDEGAMSAYLSTRAGARQIDKNGKVRQAFCESSLKMALEARHEKSFLSVLQRTPSPFKALQSIDPLDIFRAGREGCLERAIASAPTPITWLAHAIRTEDAVAMTAIVKGGARFAEPMDAALYQAYERSALCSAENTAFMNAALLNTRVQERLAQPQKKPARALARMNSI